MDNKTETLNIADAIEKLSNLTEEQKRHRDALEANRLKVTHRKQRTSRLIRRGAIAETRISMILPGDKEVADLTDQDFEEILASITGTQGL